MTVTGAHNTIPGARRGGVAVVQFRSSASNTFRNVVRASLSTATSWAAAMAMRKRRTVKSTVRWEIL